MPRPRAPKYPYRRNRPFPHERHGEGGRLVVDAVTGWTFPEAFATQGPDGIVDGRNGTALDLDVGEHEASPNNIIRPPIR